MKKVGWQDSAMSELEAKIKLAQLGVSVRVKEPVAALLTGVSKKKLQADRAANVGLPFITVACETSKGGAKPRNSVFYDLRAVLDSLKPGGGGAA